MKLYTIGFTQTTAQHFFQRLIDAGVAMLIDTRLKRDGQLAGFAKAQDLQYFLHQLASIEYLAEPLLAPTTEALRDYRDKKISWAEYADIYSGLLRSRAIENVLLPEILDGSCLLCSEHKPAHCHRRLAAEYLQNNHKGTEPLEIVHL